MRLAIVWIDFNSLLQERLRDDVVLACHPPKVGESSHHQIPSVQAFRWFALSTKVFRRVDVRLDGSNYRLRDLVLHRKYVGEPPVVPFRPDMAASGGVVQLSGNSNTVAGLADTALEYVAHTEFVGDLLHMDGLALADERRISSDYEEPTQLGQRGNDVLAYAVRKIFLLRVSAHVAEGKHGDCRADRAAAALVASGRLAPPAISREILPARCRLVPNASHQQSENPCEIWFGSAFGPRRCPRSLSELR